MKMIIRMESYCFPIDAYDGSFYKFAFGGFELHPVADMKLGDSRLASCLVPRFDMLDKPFVKIEQFFICEFGEINLYSHFILLSLLFSQENA